MNTIMQLWIKEDDKVNMKEDQSRVEQTRVENVIQHKNNITKSLKRINFKQKMKQKTEAV